VQLENQEITVDC